VIKIAFSEVWLWQLDNILICMQLMLILHTHTHLLKSMYLRYAHPYPCSSSFFSNCEHWRSWCSS